MVLYIYIYIPLRKGFPLWDGWPQPVFTCFDHGTNMCLKSTIGP